MSFSLSKILNTLSDNPKEYNRLNYSCKRLLLHGANISHFNNDALYIFVLPLICLRSCNDAQFNHSQTPRSLFKTHSSTCNVIQ